jgi:hypothetical protein
MTDQKPMCPCCLEHVSRFLPYIFDVGENQRWHTRCYRATYPEKFEDQKEEAQ